MKTGNNGQNKEVPVTSQKKDVKKVKEYITNEEKEFFNTEKANIKTERKQKEEVQEQLQ